MIFCSGVLGEGSFGVVFKAKRKNDGHPFAVKRVSSHFAKFGRPSEERKIHENLGHPNIVKLHDAFYLGGGLFLVLDLAHADLKHVIDTRKFRPGSFGDSMRLTTCRGAARGLQYEV